MGNSSLSELVNQKWSSSVECVDMGTETDLKESKKSILVAENMPVPDLLGHVLQNHGQHVVQSNNISVKEELNASALMIQNPKDFFSYPLSSILTPESAGLEQEKKLLEFEFLFSNNTQKKELSEKFQAYCESVSNSSSFLSEAHLILDELFTNAIYNAPVASSDHPDSPTPRSLPFVEMHSNKKGRIFSGRTENRVIIGCEDQFGSLNLRSFVDRIRKCCDLGPDKMMRFDEGGAGIGSFLVFMTNTSMFVAVEKNIRTIVCVTLPLKMSNRKKSELPKNFHCIEIS